MTPWLYPQNASGSRPARDKSNAGVPSVIAGVKTNAAAERFSNANADNAGASGRLADCRALVQPMRNTAMKMDAMRNTPYCLSKAMPRA